LSPVSWTAHGLGLSLGFAAMLGLMAALAFIGLYYLDAAERQLQSVVRVHMKKASLTNQMYRAARERTVSLQNMALLSDPFDLDEQWMIFNANAGNFARARMALLETGLSSQEQALLGKQGLLTGVAVPLQEEVAQLTLDGKVQAAHDVLVNQAIPAQDRVLELINELRRLQEQAAEAALQQVKGEHESARHLVLLLSAAIIGVGLVIAVGAVGRQRAAHRALRQEKEHAQVTLHSIGDAVIRTDRTGLIEYLNPVAERLVGWRIADARGRPLLSAFHVVHDGTRTPAVNPAVQALEEDTVVTGADDLLLVARDGSEHAVELIASPMRDEGGGQVGAVVVFRDVTEVRALAREVQYQATHDVLTGLTNRVEFERHVEAALREARAHGREYALFYLDLDLFKVVNDSCGHLAGDELLRQLAVLVRQRLRRGDQLARIGGDEFGVLLADCPLDKASEIANQVRASVRSFRFLWEDSGFEIGASIGVVPVSAQSGSINDVLRAADFACRTAKDQGRNCVHTLADQDVGGTPGHREIDWPARISRALSRNRFVLYGQWIHPLDGDPGRPSHCEVLLRLEDDGHVVPPSAFLPAAERYHLMPSIDRWVIESACASLNNVCWGDKPWLGCFNINLSGQSLCDPEFLAFVIGCIKTSGVPPAHLCFEITETAAVTNLTYAMHLITILKDIGCRFALDDFGTGLSSFTYLKHMKVDYLKIDGTFVRNIPEDRTDLALIDSINQVARSMGIETVAEHVENELVKSALSELHIDYCQGYAIARPVRLSDILAQTAEEDGQALAVASQPA
jgi:diguanylate cyclase (GGDEF)-like protein/PAS domain S-box-containing protein